MDFLLRMKIQWELAPIWVKLVAPWALSVLILGGIGVGTYFLG